MEVHFERSGLIVEKEERVGFGLVWFHGIFRGSEEFCRCGDSGELGVESVTFTFSCLELEDGNCTLCTLSIFIYCGGF